MPSTRACEAPAQAWDGIRTSIEYAMNLSGLERDFGVTHPDGFRAAAIDLAALMKSASFIEAFAAKHFLLAVPDVRSAAREAGDERLLPFMPSDGRFPDIYAFDLNSPPPDHTVIVWRVHARVHQWSGFVEFLRCLVQSAVRRIPLDEFVIGSRQAASCVFHSRTYLANGWLD